MYTSQKKIFKYPLYQLLKKKTTPLNYLKENVKENHKIILYAYHKC